MQAGAPWGAPRMQPLTTLGNGHEPGPPPGNVGHRVLLLRDQGGLTAAQLPHFPDEETDGNLTRHGTCYLISQLLHLYREHLKEQK